MAYFLNDPICLVIMSRTRALSTFKQSSVYQYFAKENNFLQQVQINNQRWI